MKNKQLYLPFKQFIILIPCVFIVNLCRCQEIKKTTNELPGLEKMPVNDTMLIILNVVDETLDYFPSQNRESRRKVTSPAYAYREAKRLYPDFKHDIMAWTEYHGYYIFSIGAKNTNEHRLFFNIIYVKKNEKNFRHFWPAT